MVSHKKKKAEIYTSPETRGKKQKQPIFTMNISEIGNVPMLFFIPNLKPNDKLREQIESNGGMVVNMYESYVYQISTIKTVRSTTSTYYKGYIYHSKWITDSIDKGRLLESNKKYLLKYNKSSKLETIPKGKRRQYTISEVMKLFDLSEKCKSKECPQMKFFQKIVTENTIPGRSAESLRTAWK